MSCNDPGLEWPRHCSRVSQGRTQVTCLLWVWMCAQSCSTLCDPMDYSLPGSSVHRLFWGRILEWVAIFYFRGSPLIQGLNLCLLQWQVRVFFFFPLSPLSHLRSPALVPPLNSSRSGGPTAWASQDWPSLRIKVFLWAGYEQEFLNLPPELEGYYVSGYSDK